MEYFDMNIKEKLRGGFVGIVSILIVALLITAWLSA